MTHRPPTAAGFTAELAAGRLTRAGYARYARELFEVYTALEDAAVALAGDPLAAPFLLAGLRRRVMLGADLAYFHGPRWESDLEHLPPLPATCRYAERIRAVAPASPEHYVAHASVRCLADVSRAPRVSGYAARVVGVEPGAPGVAFYAYEQPEALHRRFRGLLDAGPWTADQLREIVGEVCVARRLDADLAAELAAEASPSGLMLPTR